MRMFDTFIDEKRKRITQCKAFSCDLELYKIGTKVKNPPSDARLYYVETEVPFRFIEIFDNCFFGIVDVNEVDISEYPCFSYLGEPIYPDYALLKQYSKLWKAYTKSSEQLPYNLQELYDYEVLNKPLKDFWIDTP